MMTKKGIDDKELPVATPVPGLAALGMHWLTTSDNRLPVAFLAQTAPLVAVSWEPDIGGVEVSDIAIKELKTALCDSLKNIVEINSKYPDSNKLKELINQIPDKAFKITNYEVDWETLLIKACYLLGMICVVIVLVGFLTPLSQGLIIGLVGPAAIFAFLFIYSSGFHLTKIGFRGVYDELFKKPVREYSVFFQSPYENEDQFNKLKDEIIKKANPPDDVQTPVGGMSSNRR
jgi:hypothetical protein